MTNDYLIKKVSKAYMLPSIITGLAVTIGFVIDGIITGNLIGEKGLAVVGLASPLFLFLSGMAGMLSEGGVALCGEYIGRGEREKVKMNFTIAIISSTLIGVLVTIFGVLCIDTLAKLLGAKDELLFFFKEYTTGICLGAVPIMLSQVIFQYVQMDGSPILCGISAIAAIILNAALDIIFVKVFNMEMFGVGLATSISYTAVTMILCIHFFDKINTLRLSYLKDPLKELKRIAFIGFPTVLERWSYTLRVTILNHLLLIAGGTMAVTAFAIQYDVDSFVSSITIGVGMNVLLLSSIFYGEQDARSLKDTIKVSTVAGLLLSAIASAFLFIFAPQIVSIFGGTDAELNNMAARAIRFFCPSFPLSLVSSVLINYYQGTKNIFMANIICVGENLVYVLLFSFLLAPIFGIDGVWISFFAGEIAIFTTIVIIVRIKKKKWLGSINDVLLLPESFMVKQADQIDISIGNDLNQVVNLSVTVQKFCHRHNVDSRTSYFFPLCVEEMAANVVKHAFKEGEKKFIDIRIIMKENNLIFCMRDDGVRFHPFQFLASQPEDDKFSNIGIRIVQKIASDVDYRYTVGLNNLVINFRI